MAQSIPSGILKYKIVAFNTDYIKNTKVSFSKVNIMIKLSTVSLLRVQVINFILRRASEQLCEDVIRILLKSETVADHMYYLFLINQHLVPCVCYTINHLNQ